MSDLRTLILELETKINDFDKINVEFSKSTVGWQIDHSLKVVNGVISQLKKSSADDYKWKFNLPRFIVFRIKQLPRGKANAPKTLRTYDEILKQDLINQIETAKKLILDFHNLPKKSNFKHPYFGILNLNQSNKFLQIHTDHHLKIINDILK